MEEFREVVGLWEVGAGANLQRSRRDWGVLEALRAVEETYADLVTRDFSGLSES
jgi:hypothetical protein